MKSTLLLFLVVLFNLNITSAQEVIVETSLFDLLIEPVVLKEVMIMRSNEISLGTGQWTDIDRIYNQPRFNEAMEYIALNNRTDLLYDLSQISSYYSYLGNSPIIRKFGIKWQNEAATLTNDLHLMSASIGTALLTGTLYVELNRTSNQADPIYKELERLIDEGISSAGLDFINGTASKMIVADVTKNYYSPLLKGEKKSLNPFEFDADILYNEQYKIAQTPYYSKFNDLDNILIVGWYSKVYALADLDILSDLDFLLHPNLDLTKPRNRFILGLKRMGYSDVKINAYLERIKK